MKPQSHISPVPAAEDPMTVADRRLIDGAMVRGMGLVVLFAAIAGVARVAQDAAIAWRFGTGPVVDAYYFMVSLANWPVAVVLALLTILVPPTEARLRSGEREAPIQHFRAELLAAVLLLALASLPVAWWALRFVAAGNTGGLESAAAAHAAAGVPGLAGLIPLGLVGALLSAWFIAAGRHVLTLLEALPALVLVAVVLLLQGPMLFWGTTAGVAVQVLVMALVLRRCGELPRPRTGFSASSWSTFSRGAFVMLGGQTLFALIPLIDAVFAAGLGDGAVATLSYANRLVLGLLGIAGLALQRGGLPLLSRLSARSPVASRQTALRWAAVAAVVGAVVGLVVALVADPLVSLLFERGSFTAGDRAEVAKLLRYGMMQMPPFLAGVALVTALASVHATQALSAAAVVGASVKLLLSMALVPRYGAVGLLLATALMYAATAAASWLVLRRHLRQAAS
jgi:peptidoglycan biosynthesis protein MviN/MurJ (putative lipid II flippase)